jgi:hypothetical protein
MAKKKTWVQKADKKMEKKGTEGALTRQAKARGYSSALPFARAVVKAWDRSKKTGKPPTVLNKKTGKQSAVDTQLWRRANFAVNVQPKNGNGKKKGNPRKNSPQKKSNPSLAEKAKLGEEWGTLYDIKTATPADIETAYKRALVFEKKEKAEELRKRQRSGPKRYVVKHYCSAAELGCKNPGWREPEWFDDLPIPLRTLGNAKRLAQMDFDSGYETAVFRNGKKVWEPK